MRLILLWLFVSLGFLQAEPAPANWSANVPPCNRHTELLKQGHMDLGVRISTTNPDVAEQFRRAMDSWAAVIDLDWYEDDTQNCAMEVVDGQEELFAPKPKLIVARAQLPDRDDFQGWIAFNPSQSLDPNELFWVAMHEIGHMLGLQHSANAKSVMYGLSLEGLEWLDADDLAVLAARHKLRFHNLELPVLLKKP